MRAVGLKIIMLTVLALCTANASYADDATTSATETFGHLNLRTAQALFPAPQTGATFRAHLAHDFGGEVYSRQTAAWVQQPPATGRERTVGRKILGGVVLGAIGFFGGGYLGAAIEGDRCNCDDPGLMGALIGAPVGAAVGAILGVKFF